VFSSIYIKISQGNPYDVLLLPWFPTLLRKKVLGCEMSRKLMFVMPCYRDSNKISWEPGLHSRYRNLLRAGRSRDRIPVGGEIFRTFPERLWGPPNSGYRVFPGSKTARAWRWPPTPSSTDVKESEELYFSCESSWPVQGWTLPVPVIKGKAIPLQALTGPEGSTRLRLPDFKTISTWKL
jgi:hypothetical protein